MLRECPRQKAQKATKRTGPDSPTEPIHRGSAGGGKRNSSSFGLGSGGGDMVSLCLFSTAWDERAYETTE